MLATNLNAVALEILRESGWKQEKALPALIKRLENDKAMLHAIIHEAASSVLREAASQQRTKLHRLSNRGGTDDTRGLAIIAKEGYLDTYLLLNSVRLGDANDGDLAEAISDTYSREKTLKSKRLFLEAIRKSPKFKKGRRVRDCFTDLEIARLAGDFKC
jgi:hypothetical protein